MNPKAMAIAAVVLSSMAVFAVAWQYATTQSSNQDGIVEVVQQGPSGWAGRWAPEPTTFDDGFEQLVVLQSLFETASDDLVTYEPEFVAAVFDAFDSLSASEKWHASWKYERLLGKGSPRERVSVADECEMRRG